MTKVVMVLAGLCMVAGLCLVKIGSLQSNPPSRQRSRHPRTPCGSSLRIFFVPSDIYGTNDSIEYASPNVDDLPSVQAALKSGGLTLMRTWAYDTDSDASIMQRIATINNSGHELHDDAGQHG